MTSITGAVVDWGGGECPWDIIGEAAGADLAADTGAGSVGNGTTRIERSASSGEEMAAGASDRRPTPPPALGWSERFAEGGTLAAGAGAVAAFCSFN